MHNYTHTTRKPKVVQGHFTYQTIALLLEISILLVTAVCKTRSASYDSKHGMQPLQYDIVCVLILITKKLQVICRRSTYRTTALLPEMSIFCVRAGCEIRMVRYASKHALQSLSDKPFLGIDTQRENFRSYVDVQHIE